MIMRFLIFFLIQILFLNVIYAQEYTVEWNTELINHNIGEKEFKVLSIANESSYQDDYNLPHFYNNQKVDGESDLKFEILSEEDIPLSKLGDIQLIDIPIQPTYELGVYKNKNQYNKVVDVIPLYKKDNQVKKILSFRINSTALINNYRIYRKQGKINPVLAKENGRFYKISIDTTGVYKIDKNFLTQNGISTSFNPSKFKIYGNGGMVLPENPGDFRYQGLQEVALQSVGLEDGTFDDGDYFLFYAQGPNGLVREESRGQITGNHSIHPYEDKAYYFINFDEASNGKRVKSSAFDETNVVKSFSDFNQVLFYEKDLTNIYNVGRLWVGEDFYQESTFNIQFDGSGLVNNPALSYGMVGTNADNTSFSISVNGNQITQNNLGSSELNTKKSSVDFSSTTYPLNVQINVDNSLNPSAGIYLDYIRLNFTQKLQFNNQQLGFRWFQEMTEDSNYAFTLAGSPDLVWDVSDRVNAKQLLPQNNQYSFKAKSKQFPNEFIAFNLSQVFVPNYEGLIENQTLTALDGIDYVIVTHPDFINQANKLAKAHESVSGVKTAVATTQQVYNEFGSGSQDISAIRDFFKYLYDNGKLKYALLLGDSSYDFKDRISVNTNMVPTYQSDASVGLSNTYVTDDFFGILDDTDIGINVSQVDIAVGRLPANTANEAEVLVNKTLSYLSQNTAYGTSFGDWRTKITFLVDDDNPGLGNAFHATVEQKAAQYLEQKFPFYTIEKLYADAFEQVGTSAGLRFPALEKKIVNTIESGTLLLNYFGHGGFNGLAQERFLTQNTVKDLTNYSKEYARLPVVLTITCDFTVWDIPQITSAGEMMLKNPNGGAVAMITTSRELSVSYGLAMNDVVIKELFKVDGNKYVPIGEALRKAKIDKSGNQALKINLMGDPLLSLAKPTRNVEIEKINGTAFNQFSGVIKALDFVKIEGSVSELNSFNIDTSFNGKVNGILFDKVQNKTTLNNDGDIDVLQYKEQTNAIYRGSSSVKNGKFIFEFYVPKDINFDVGNGKILFYAENGKDDGVGFKNDIQVGGINPNGVDDNQGPVVGLYMNNLNFAPGGITDRSPYLLACITDDTGINATGSGVGHDITQLLDGNINSTIVLNDFFEGGDASPCLNPNVKDYQKGRVLYKLNDLDLGEHTVTFRVWDINNNSTTETLDFVVMQDGDQKLIINKLLNWPNPFTTQTYFHFEHNCPDILEVQVQIFTIAGKLVKTIRQTVSSEPFREGYRTGKFEIPWSGLDDFGNKIGKGVYIYKTTVKGSNGETCKGQTSATEKLVILK